RHAVHLAATLAGGHAANDLGAVIEHVASVKGAIPPGDALHQDTCLCVDENAHAAPRRAAAIAFCTTSSMVPAVSSAVPASKRRASASLVPASRTTMGQRGGLLPTTVRIPRATSSQRVMPPKMLKRMDRTFASA